MLLVLRLVFSNHGEKLAGSYLLLVYLIVGGKVEDLARR